MRFIVAFPPHLNQVCHLEQATKLVVPRKPHALSSRASVLCAARDLSEPREASRFGDASIARSAHIHIFAVSHHFPCPPWFAPNSRN
jgi:hypothetical protein